MQCRCRVHSNSDGDGFARDDVGGFPACDGRLRINSASSPQLAAPTLHGVVYSAQYQPHNWKAYMNLSKGSMDGMHNSESNDCTYRMTGSRNHVNRGRYLMVHLLLLTYLVVSQLRSEKPSCQKQFALGLGHGLTVPSNGLGAIFSD